MKKIAVTYSMFFEDGIIKVESNFHGVDYDGVLNRIDSGDDVDPAELCLVGIVETAENFIYEVSKPASDIDDIDDNDDILVH